MNIAQLIQTLVATVVGGLIVIATNWLSARGKRKEAVQEWYERTYIIEGIDPLVAYYQYLAFTLFSTANANRVLSIVKRDIPVEALNHVRILLKGDVIPLNIILAAHYQLAEVTEQKVLLESAQTVQKAVEVLLIFRVELTEVISRRVGNKHYVANTTRLISNLEKVDQELKNLVEHSKRQKSGMGVEKA